MCTKHVAASMVAAMTLFAGSVKANTELKTLTISSSPFGSIVASPAATLYPKGTKIQIQAVPNSGNLFLGWTAGSNSTTAVDSIAVNSDTTVSALFVSGSEMTPYGGFDFGLKGWSKWNDASLTSTFTTLNGVAQIHPGGTSPGYTYVQFWYWQPSIAEKTTYVANFTIKASCPRASRVVLRNHTSPWADLTTAQKISIDTVFTHKCLTFVTTASSTSARFAFDFGLDSATVWLDSVSLHPLTFAGRAMQSAGILSLRTMRKALMVTTDEPAKWVLRTPDGKLVRAGRFDNPGEQTIWNVPEGVGIFTLQSATNVQVVRISVF